MEHRFQVGEYFRKEGWFSGITDFFDETVYRVLKLNGLLTDAT
jgi:hypothetical protein